jgi:GNAT superfamily N-acetyltransferase
MTLYHREIGPYEVRRAAKTDLPGARSLMLDTFYHEFGYGYRPEWHGDVIDLEGAYLAAERHALFVAVKGDEVVATTGVRSEGLSSPPHPASLAARYPDGSTAQLFRVYVRPEHRRCGLARALVNMATAFVTQTPGYERLYLHTDTRVAGAEPFWRSIAKDVYDNRDGDPVNFQTVHFEIPMEN